AARHGGARRQRRSRDGAIARRQHRLSISPGVRGGRRAPGVCRADRGAPLVGLFRAGAPRAGHLFFRGGGGRGRFGAWRVRRRAAGGIRRYVRQGVLPGSSRRAGVRDDGGDPALEARRSVSPGIVMPRFAPQAALVLAIVAALGLFPLLGGKYEIDLVAKIFVLAILSLSFGVLVG